MSDVLSWIRLSGPFMIGHRGFPTAARENTLPSFEAALEASCDGVELDVRLTEDGVAVVHHDETVEGDEGQEKIAELPWKRIEGRTFLSGQRSYPIHRLDQVLETLSGRGLINVEVKPPVDEHHDRTAAVVIDCVDRVRPRESLLISSFDPAMLNAIRTRDRGLLLGFLFSSNRDFNHLEQDEAVDVLSAIHPRHDLVDAKLVKRAGERGLNVHTWTVDDPAEATRLLDLGVTSVITNRPDKVAQALY